MADNYLEKRMDDYARGRLGSKGAAAGRRYIKYPHLQVLIADCDTLECGVAIVKMLVDAGCTVCITAADKKNGTEISRSCGARFYPMDYNGIAQDISRRGEKVDAIVLLNPSSIDKAIDATAMLEPDRWLIVSDVMPEASDNRMISSVAVREPEATAILTLALLHPDVEGGIRL